MKRNLELTYSAISYDSWYYISLKQIVIMEKSHVNLSYLVPKRITPSFPYTNLRLVRESIPSKDLICSHVVKIGLWLIDFLKNM